MPIKKNRPKPTGVPGISQDGPNRFLVRARWTDPRTGRRRKREGVAASLAEGRTKGPRGRGLGVDEFRRFLAAANDLQGKERSEDISRLLQTLAWTGMRKGEALALRWSDIVDGEIHVVRSVWHRQEKPTKTDDPRRVTVVAPLAAIFEEQRRWLFSTQ